MLTYCYWPTAALLMAIGQGLLLPTLRQEPAASAAARRNNRSLHGVLVVAYFLPLSLLPLVNCQLIIDNCIAAVLSRLLLFDVALNCAAGDKAFSVGSTARTDKVIRWLATRLSWPAERLRLVVWVVSLVICCLLVYLYR